MRRIRMLAVLAAVGGVAAALAVGSSAAQATNAAGPASGARGALVSVASPTGQFPRNVQNMPTLAVDPVAPDVLVAGGNDLVDMQPCSEQAAVAAGGCAEGPTGTVRAGHFNLGVGLSSAYFSFNKGRSWIQPTYQGLTAAGCTPTAEPCTPQPGSIHTVPNFYGNGLRSRGNVSVAFGPVRKDGRFSWANGSRLYYSTIATNLTDTAIQPGRIDSAYTMTTSFLDNPTPDRVARQSNWSKPIIVPEHESSIDFPLGGQIWADNAGSSRHFGNVYVCYDNFVVPATGSTLPIVPTVGVSADGGQTWTTHQIAPPVDSASDGYRQGCGIRTDSQGTVYAFITHYSGAFPSSTTAGEETMIKSFDGGRTWTQPNDFMTVNTACYNTDPIVGLCAMEGPAGARSDFQPNPSVDIANGAPTGARATNEIVLAWSDGRFGQNHEATLLSHSGNNGQTWSAPATVSLPGDRAMYSAAAIAPDGSRVYLTYNAFTTPFTTTTSAPRLEHGVLRSAKIGPDGAPAGWTTDFVGPSGDARGTSQADVNYSEYLGNYISAIATRSYGAGVWTDMPRAADCPAVDAWRQASFTAGSVTSPAPWPLAACPASFGNSDLSSATTAR